MPPDRRASPRLADGTRRVRRGVFCSVCTVAIVSTTAGDSGRALAERSAQRPPVNTMRTGTGWRGPLCQKKRKNERKKKKEKREVALFAVQWWVDR